MPRIVVQTMAYTITKLDLLHFPFIVHTGDLSGDLSGDLFGDLTGGIYWHVNKKKTVSSLQNKFTPEIRTNEFYNHIL